MERFIINSDGTVKDTETGLMWDRETHGRMKWNEAIAFCRSLTKAGYDDWRLPTIEELFSIVDYSRHNPAINTTTFSDNNTCSYWSSSAVADYPEGAWLVYFYNGGVDNCHKGYEYYVRAVRTIKTKETGKCRKS